MVVKAFQPPLMHTLSIRIIDEMVEERNTEVKLLIMSFVDTSKSFLFDVNFKKSNNILKLIMKL